MNTANINSLCADVIVEELIRRGVDYFCISPGSRSTPLTAVIAARKESGELGGDAVVHFDERGAAFHALGYSRATRKPAALICTSGTAAVNYYPAFVEASQDNVPLIALTADRPPELRNTGANQTIDQLNLYGKYVRWFSDLPCPSEEIDFQELLTAIDRAVSAAMGTTAGPVHLNCPLREPLAPIAEGPDLSDKAKQLESWYLSGQPFEEPISPARSVSDDKISTIAEIVEKSKDGLIVAGRLDDESQRAALLSLSQKIGWPLLADITSGLRFNSSNHIIHHYDLLLASEDFARAIRPAAVLQFGGRFVSKRLLQFVEQLAPPEYILVNDSPANLDPARCATQNVTCDIAAFCESLRGAVEQTEDTAYLEMWQRANETTQRVLSAECDRATELTEAAVARHISQQLADGTGLFLASSMPVRDMDMFGGANDNEIAVAANRGASGIDGTIASATGFAAGLGRPVTLLIGDLACLHDLNSLALLKKVAHPVAVVVVNNDGGGIFQHLPIAGLPDVFEKYFVAPHGLNFEHAAGLFDLPYCRVGDKTAFGQAYTLSQQSERSSIIEVSLDRTHSVSFHQSVRSGVVAALKGLHL